jgi:hypothetical protein
MLVVLEDPKVGEPIAASPMVMRWQVRKLSAPYPRKKEKGGEAVIPDLSVVLLTLRVGVDVPFEFSAGAGKGATLVEALPLCGAAARGDALVANPWVAVTVAVVGAVLFVSRRLATVLSGKGEGAAYNDSRVGDAVDQVDAFHALDNAVGGRGSNRTREGTVQDGGECEEGGRKHCQRDVWSR